MRRLGPPFISAWMLHRSRSLEQVEVSMFQIRVNGAEMKRLPVDRAMMNSLRFDGAAMKSLRVACALAFALGFARIAFADSMEVAELASADSTEVAAVILSDDAMPRGPSVAARLAIIREKIQNALEYPPLAQLHDSDGDALVRFEIEVLEMTWSNSHLDFGASSLVLRSGSFDECVRLPAAERKIGARSVPIDRLRGPWSESREHLYYARPTRGSQRRSRSRDERN